MGSDCISDGLSRWQVRGEDVPVAPLPATHERLSAFIKARHAFYGSLLMGILAHHLTVSAGAMLKLVQLSERFWLA